MINPEWEKLGPEHDVVFVSADDYLTMNVNPVPKCLECGGRHELIGVRSDCIKFWKERAIASIELVECARSLLSSATPNSKFLDKAHELKWAKEFGKWYAASQSIPPLSDLLLDHK